MSSKTSDFSQFGLEKSILSALSDLGYEGATPIQQQGIPVLLNGEDLLAQAQTGTGKTATFALPILSQLDHSLRAPQALIMAPTRELAIQVAEAFQSYAKHIKGFSVTPIYGGQDIGTQLRALKRGSQVIVGTPGRLMDHMRRNTLALDALKIIVLDEADEMLKMGFAEDVEWILSQMTAPHQTALFSATMPASIQKISQKYLKNPQKIQIKAQLNAVETIEQSYISVSRGQKLDVLTRLMEVEENQGVIIFTRTKNDSTELAEKLQARGYSSAALNGDMSQGAREKTIQRLKNGQLDILVATDVAARGIDVERVTHVINYDIPYDVDAYIHRIGRTGRAGRNGKAILFVQPREMRMLSEIERHIKKTIKRIEPPSLKVIREKRTEQLSEKILSLVQDKSKQLAPYVEIVMNLTEKHSLSAKDVAAALIYLNDAQSSLSQTNTPEASPEGSNRDYGRERRRDRDQSNDKNPRRKYGSDKSRKFAAEKSERYKSDKPAGKFGSEKSDKYRSEKPAGKFSSEKSEKYRSEKPAGKFGSEKSDKYRSEKPAGKFSSEKSEKYRSEKPAGKYRSEKPDSWKPRKEKPFKKA